MALIKQNEIYIDKNKDGFQICIRNPTDDPFGMTIEDCDTFLLLKVYRLDNVEEIKIYDYK